MGPTAIGAKFAQRMSFLVEPFRADDLALRLPRSSGMTARDLVTAGRGAGRHAAVLRRHRAEVPRALVVALHHSILNPLSGILGALHVLKDDSLPAGTKSDLLAQAEAEIRRIEEVVRDLRSARVSRLVPYVGAEMMFDLGRRGARAPVAGPADRAEAHSERCA